MGRLAKVSGSTRSKSITVLGSLPDPPAWLTGRVLRSGSGFVISFKLAAS